MLAGMERPGLFWRLEEDLDFLRNEGIRTIVNLEEYAWDYGVLRVKHIPIKDFRAPRLDYIEEFVRFVDDELREGRPVVVHCYAGIGRTNLMLAAYFVYLGMEPINALNLLKEKRPYHAVNEEQENALSEYFYFIKKTT
jgi:protein-tyrosine phosphatase